MEFINIDYEDSIYDLNKLEILNKAYSKESFNSKKDIIKKFYSDFFIKEFLPFLELLISVSELNYETAWDIVHYSVFKFLNYNENDELYLYLKDRHPVFNKEIRKALDPNGDGYIYIRNSCCGKYTTKVNENCKICPFLHG